MSYSFEVACVQTFKADTTLAALLGTASDGSPAVHPAHFRDVQDPAYPMITIFRADSGSRDTVQFSEAPVFVTQMDNVKFVVQIWDKKNVDNCWAAFRRVDQLLRGALPNTIKSHYMVNYKIRRRTVRDGLFDTVVNAYQLYAEYETWVYDNPVNIIPIPS